jgi:hypothetical protein
MLFSYFNNISYGTAVGAQLKTGAASCRCSKNFRNFIFLKKFLHILCKRCNLYFGDNLNWRLRAAVFAALKTSPFLAWKKYMR